MTDVSLTEGDTATFASDVERHEVHFSFVDGRIVDICSSPDETTLALNIKKGVLSAFQMSSDDWTKSQNITEVRSQWGLLKGGVETGSMYVQYVQGI